MFRTALVLGSCVLVMSQQAGEVKPNFNLPLPIARCTKENGCVEEPTTVTMDANWRWLHEKGGFANCFVDGSWSAAACRTGADCASNCVIEGIEESDWAETYGISRRAGGVRVNFKTGGNVGSRFYLLDTTQAYKQFSLLNREIAFDVDVSTIPCGMNGAVYFSEMPANGDKSSTNTAGSAYGTGYCDAQCPADVKFISGEANSEGWDTSARKGKYGSCCAEMDLWEANKKATAFTAHPCALDQLYRCEGAECKTICDMPGCDYNSYRMGARDFYGPGPQYAVNTLRPFTIVTQFITADGSDHGDLAEIRRFYVQDGKKIENSKATLQGLGNQSSLSDESCARDKQVFGETNTLAKFGGMKQMGEALSRGMTLVLSLWDDGASRMHWLDSNDPAGESPEKPGVARGPCPEGAGDPSYVRSHHANAFAEYFNFKYGELGSTTNGHASAPAAPRAPLSPPAPAPMPGAPAVGSKGRCCYGGCNGQCKDPSSWCSQSWNNCEGACKGEWCAAAVLSQVKPHRQLRGKDHMFIQKLRRFSVGKKSLHKFKGDSAEL